MEVAEREREPEICLKLKKGHWAGERNLTAINIWARLLTGSRKSVQWVRKETLKEINAHTQKIKRNKWKEKYQHFLKGRNNKNFCHLCQLFSEFLRGMIAHTYKTRTLEAKAEGTLQTWSQITHLCGKFQASSISLMTWVPSLTPKKWKREKDSLKLTLTVTMHHDTNTFSSHTCKHIN